MKLSTLICASVVALAAATTAAAHDVQFSTALTGAAEIPSNASPATGSGLVTVDLDTLMMDVHISFAGLIGTTTASHIHCCTTVPGSSNAAVATMLPSFDGFPTGVSAGTYDHTFDMSLASSYNPDFVTLNGGVSNAFSALIAGMGTGNAYLNIHTTEFPGGEIRGLMQPVPEPETYMLMIIGLAALGWLTRRRDLRNLT